jgi:hypothetical protein
MGTVIERITFEVVRKSAGKRKPTVETVTITRRRTNVRVNKTGSVDEIMSLAFEALRGFPRQIEKK